jgi:predicted amidohydrolase YtcJ
VVECGGGALIPGLHDHHLHLLSMAAAAASVDVSGGLMGGGQAGGSSPGASGGGLDAAIRTADAQALPGASIRAVGYDEMRDGPLDRWRLDALAPGRAVRVQHRSGALWILSTVALREVGAFETGEEGIERDHLGQPTGRLFRLDGWLRGRGDLPDRTADRTADRTPGRTAARVAPDLAAVGRRLASYGVTGVTDCTPAADSAYFEPIADAVRSGTLPLTVWVTGGPELSEATPPHPLQRGPVKILITDHAFPSLDQVSEGFIRAHGAGRAVAVHCVSRAGLLLALAAWQAVGSVPGDRVEHASVVPLEVVASLRELSLTVVTQPGFLAARGDAYLAEVEPDDQPDLYRCASLQEGGVPVGGSTDAPFGPDDPWVAMRAAMERRAASGATVGLDRGLEPAAAMGLFLGPPEHPGGPRRRVIPGAAADLCLLDVPLRTVLREPDRGHVAATFAQGQRTYTA